MKRDLTKYAQNLRKNMTKEELHLWLDFLKPLPILVKRQHIIEKYIVDFYIPQLKLAIEIDGSQHYEDEGKEADKIRDEFLKSKGITVLRYSNYEINNHFKDVCNDILKNFGMEV